MGKLVVNSIFRSKINILSMIMLILGGLVSSGVISADQKEAILGVLVTAGPALIIVMRSFFTVPPWLDAVQKDILEYQKNKQGFNISVQPTQFNRNRK